MYASLCVPPAKNTNVAKYKNMFGYSLMYILIISGICVFKHIFRRKKMLRSKRKIILKNVIKNYCTTYVSCFFFYTIKNLLNS